MTLDPQTIKHYWTAHPTANIALQTGEKSGIVVVDLDIRPGVNGIREWNRKIDTLASTSARGGIHLFYRWTRYIGTRLDPARGIDIFGDRTGSIIVPPSTVEGVMYQWINDLPMIDFQF